MTGLQSQAFGSSKDVEPVSRRAWRLPFFSKAFGLLVVGGLDTGYRSGRRLELLLFLPSSPIELFVGHKLCPGCTWQAPLCLLCLRPFTVPMLHVLIPCCCVVAPLPPVSLTLLSTGAAPPLVDGFTRPDETCRLTLASGEDWNAAEEWCMCPRVIVRFYCAAGGGVCGRCLPH